MNSFSHKWKKQHGVLTSEISFPTDTRDLERDILPARALMVSELQGLKVQLVSFQQEGKNPEDDQIRNGQCGCLFSRVHKDSLLRTGLWSSSPGCIAMGYYQNGTVPRTDLLEKKYLIKMWKCWLDNSWPVPACSPFITHAVWDEKTGMQSTWGCVVVGVWSLPGEFPKNRMTKGNSWGLQSKEMSGRTLQGEAILQWVTLGSGLISLPKEAKVIASD